MAASSVSCMVGGFFILVGIFGLALNTTVLFAIYKGRLLSSKTSSVYILSSQTLAVDTLMVLVHLLYHAPSVTLQRNLTIPELDFIFEFLLMYCWFHNSLSHILIALNRLAVIVFKRSDLFTRQRTIILSIPHHLTAAALSVGTEFISPCCKMTFSWPAYSYMYIEKEGILNYSAMVMLPIEATSSLISIVTYAVIVLTMRNARRKESKVSREIDRKRRVQEYRYAIQFAIMALVYSLSWILFNILPVIIGNTTKLYIYGLITTCVETNALANATVYLSNNKEIKNALRGTIKKASKVHSISDKKQSTVSTK